MSLFRDLERRIDERLRSFFRPDSQPGRRQELIEIQRFILDRIDDRVQQLPRARRVFPYNEIAVRIPVPDQESGVALETVFVADDALQEAVRDHLQDDAVEFPRDLKVDVTLVPPPANLTEPSLVFHKSERPTPASQTQPALRTVRFTAEGSDVFEISKTRVQIGRTAEVLDDRRRLVRKNDVVLGHDTVSRAHAHIEFGGGEYRVFDDGSSYGTSVIRGGRLVEVPQAGGRGQRIESGDEIYFGQMRVRFEIL